MGNMSSVSEGEKIPIDQDKHKEMVYAEADHDKKKTTFYDGSIKYWKDQSQYKDDHDKGGIQGRHKWFS